MMMADEQAAATHDWAVSGIRERLESGMSLGEALAPFESRFAQNIIVAIKVVREACRVSLFTTRVLIEPWRAGVASLRHLHVSEIRLLGELDAGPTSANLIARHLHWALVAGEPFLLLSPGAAGQSREHRGTAAPTEWTGTCAGDLAAHRADLSEFRRLYPQWAEGVEVWKDESDLLLLHFSRVPEPPPSPETG